jgi:hypothetical protein
MTQINFWSGKNYMKRDSSSGSQAVAAPATLLLGNYVTITPIPHNLGFVPMFRTYYEPFQNGVIYPPMGNRIVGETLVNGVSGPYLVCWADATNIYLELGYWKNTLTGTYLIYYVIYRDYAL